MLREKNTAQKEQLLQNALALADYHRKTCLANQDNCGINLIYLYDLLIMAGIMVPIEDVKRFL